MAERLQHEHARMLRLRPDGSKLTWSVATMSRFDEPGRSPKPFFITWDDVSMRPDKVCATSQGQNGQSAMNQTDALDKSTQKASNNTGKLPCKLHDPERLPDWYSDAPA